MFGARPWQALQEPLDEDGISSAVLYVPPQLLELPWQLDVQVRRTGSQVLIRVFVPPTFFVPFMCSVALTVPDVTVPDDDPLPPQLRPQLPPELLEPLIE